MGTIAPNISQSQFCLRQSSQRALQAWLTAMNFLLASSFSGLFLGWYFRASLLQASLISSMVALLFSPSTEQQFLSGFGQLLLKNSYSSCPFGPCQLKNLSKVEFASQRLYSLVSSSSQLALLFLSDRTSQASAISWNLTSADFLCSLFLSGCHFAANFSQALQISKREAFSCTPRILQ